MNEVAVCAVGQRKIHNFLSVRRTQKQFHAIAGPSCFSNVRRDVSRRLPEPMEENEKKKTRHGFLFQYQPPACQGIPVATTDRSEMTQCQAEKTGDIEQTNAWARHQHKSDKEEEKIFFETMNISAKQGEGPSGQHLANFATLPSAVVKVARA